MLVLARDIAEQGTVYDPPLVKPIGGKFIVFDGNRRTTCLKLLRKPTDAPSEFQQFFKELTREGALILPEKITCQVEHDQRVIDAILQRRHNGTQRGRGQLRWDPRAKENHSRRTGGITEYPIAERVEEFLKENGYRDHTLIKRSNLQRLLGTKKHQKEFGIELDATGRLNLKRPKDQVFSALVRVAEDLRAGNLSLSDLLRAKDTAKYMETLRNDCVFSEEILSPTIGASEGGATHIPLDQIHHSQFPAEKAPYSARKRNSLIRKDKRYEFTWKEDQGKIHDLWSQLTYGLSFEKNAISIPIVLRALVELSTKAYIGRKKINAKPELAKGVVDIADYLQNNGRLNLREVSDIKRLAQSPNSNVSIEALQRVLHSTTYRISDNDLITLWDGLEPLILIAIKE
ncbi:MAG: hypothetical protein ORN49_11280 [Rhodobacteraceae bacterium]|nr:hypothetical protein [Paracoccaceae bacterium]